MGLLLPRVNDFNGRGPGQNFLGSVSQTVIVDSQHNQHVTKQRQTLTFCPRKGNEDSEIRKACAVRILHAIEGWIKVFRNQHSTVAGINKFAKAIKREANTVLLYKTTHLKKCMFYCSDKCKVGDCFKLGLFHQIEALALACIIHCNGADKHDRYFRHLLEQHELPSDVLSADFITYCNNSSGGSVMFQEKAIRHQPHWRKPNLKAEMLYGLCVLYSIVVECNRGGLSKEEAYKKVNKEVQLESSYRLFFLMLMLIFQFKNKELFLIA